MHIKFELPQIRVVKACDYKGNPVAYLEILGVPVLYAAPDHGEYENTVDGLSVGAWEDIFQQRLSDVFAQLLLANGDWGAWRANSPTGRDVHLMDTVELTREESN